MHPNFKRNFLPRKGEWCAKTVDSCLVLNDAGGRGLRADSDQGKCVLRLPYNRAEIVSNDAVNLNGWIASLEGNFLPWIGIAGDLGGTYGHHVGEHNYLFGPRISARVGRYRPFGELLIGAAHINVGNGAATDTSFANAVGGGLDYQIFGPVSVRGQLDWIHTRFFDNGQNDVRFSTGIAVHF